MTSVKLRAVERFLAELAEYVFEVSSRQAYMAVGDDEPGRSPSAEPLLAALVALLEAE